MEIWEDNELTYQGRLVNLRTGHVRLDNGRRAFREVVEHPGGVCVIPYEQREVILIRQFRIALDRVILEAPAGKIESGEAPEQRGRLELEEEIGYRAGRMIPLGHILPSVGYLNEHIYLYLALDLVATRQNLDHDEVLELVHIPLDEIQTRLNDNTLEDAKTVVGLYRTLDYLARGSL
jgi:ADP-ribose pyrophosphatase